MDPSLHRHLLRQHGIVTRQQCLASGLSRHRIDRLIASGELVAVFTGVLRDPTRLLTIDQRAMAATLAGAPDGVGSHRMALAVHGMRNYGCDLSEISSCRRIGRAGLISHRVRESPESVVVRHIPVTTPARTLLDCAGIISGQVIARFVETWLSTKMVTLAEIEREMSGVGDIARRVMDGALRSRQLVSTEADSPAEFALGMLLARHGLPLPELHHLVTMPSGAVYELDWCYPNLKIALEMDGYGVHLRSEAAFSSDRDRRNELVVNGWHVLNFTTRMLHGNPKKVVDHVRRLLDGCAA